MSTLGWWLAERQLPNGGLNGRPEKLEDVCVVVRPYSSSICLLTVRVAGNYCCLGVLQLLGALLSGDPEQARVDRRHGAHALHPLGSGALVVVVALRFGVLRSQERFYPYPLRIRTAVV